MTRARIFDGTDELVGYADRLSAAPGETVEFRVSTTLAGYEASIVRLLHGDEHPDGPGLVEQEVEGDAVRTLVGRRQALPAGSYVVAPALPALDAAATVTLATWARPTSFGAEQVLLAKWRPDGSAGLRLLLGAAGELVLEVATAAGPERVVAAVPEPLVRLREWVHLAAGCDATGHAWVRVAPARPRPGLTAPVTVEARLSAAPLLAHDGALTVAAVPAPAPGDDERGTMAAHYAGKLEAPAVYARDLDEVELVALADGTAAPAGAIVRWDFALRQDSAVAVDVAGGEHHGVVVNAPMRAVTGRRWTGEESRFGHAPDEYAAIHFHEHDLEDAGWATDFTWVVPDGLTSGVYAARLRGDGVEDRIPIVVRPPAGEASADVALLLPTMTYLAYANERLITRTDIPMPPADEVDLDSADDWLVSRPGAGRSVYDLHADGSGNCFSTALRPIANMRPTYRFWVTGGPERLGADLAIVHWLHRERTAHDVVTDHDLHAEGASLLQRYRVIVTGTHPEYWTGPMLDALAAYLEGGGRLMYLGGNGFYWVTAVDPTRPHLIELRRGFNGTRSWTSEPGEAHLASTGEQGGLWRFRGRWPNALVGVGFTAQSDSDGPGGSYLRCPDSFDPRAAFVFDGIGDDEVIGDFGLINGAAAGYEIDRADPLCGTPEHALVLASSRGRHNDSYLLTIEDSLATDPETTGTTCDKVGADLTYLEHAGGGRVFSVGSINWCASLAHDDYDNNVARITGNVLRAFRER